jgi:SAM-dependent methyltransferase
MLSLLNRILPSSLKSSFKEPLRYFIKRSTEHYHVETQQLYSLLRLQGLVPAIPSAHLQIRVSGGFDGNFFWNGNHFINDMEKALAAQGKSFEQFEKILDFGVGCGRVLIPLSFRVAPHRLYGTDIDPEAIAWFSDNYPQFGQLNCNPHLPPLQFADEQFDLIFSVSVFTHLPEEMQFAWLEELRRVVKPGGYLLLSFHGDFSTQRTSNPNIIQATQQKGFHYVASEQVMVEGLPTFYQNTFHTPEYIRQEWGKYFEVLTTIPQGIGQNQDLAVLRKR